MTDLRKAVSRRTASAYDHRGKRVVVILEPGDVIGFRFERSSKVFRAPIKRLMQQTIVWNVDAERAAKRAARKAGRS